MRIPSSKIHGRAVTDDPAANSASGGMLQTFDVNGQQLDLRRAG